MPPPGGSQYKPALGLIVIHEAEGKTNIELVLIVTLRKKAERSKAR
ncbi:MAG: hypothetical protein BWX44_01758 [Spirochaetes bacterium ADurb.Bin001]|nr:MAG: hypothetical protein BWX44_01758 [Spirochaetes bacterium ADurb.Bin001]